MDGIKNIMTVDVEDYFQVSAFEKTIDRTDWDHIQCRVKDNTLKILDLFEKYNTKATFFCLAWVAERYPELIRRIVDDGHELASHGYDHKRVTNMTRCEFESDVIKSKKILEGISGVQIKGYRAPSYSITKDNLWVHDVLAENGFKYSSSIYPVKHDLYGIPDAPRFKYETEAQNLVEFPITTVRKFGRNLPVGGGGFFRLYPYALSKWAIDNVNHEDKKPSIFYFHPWEIDKEQPVQKGIPLKTRFRHYLNLDKTQNRLERLMTDFQWVSMDNYI